MKTRFLILAIALAFASVSLAQDKNNIETSFYKSDFGFNTNFIILNLFQSAPQPPFSVMYKKYKNETKALRIGLQGSFYSNNNNSAPGINSNFSNTSNGFIELTIGGELQQILERQWTWYYGGDVVPSYSFNKSATYNNDQKTNSNKTSGYGLGLKPFLGIRYNITPRLYIAAEASAQLTYSISKALDERYNPEQTVRDMTFNNVSFNFNPASGIFVFYRF